MQDRKGMSVYYYVGIIQVVSQSPATKRRRFSESTIGRDKVLA